MALQFDCDSHIIRETNAVKSGKIYHLSRHTLAAKPWCNNGQGKVQTKNR